MDTRWNTTFYMLNSIIDIHDVLSLYAGKYESITALTHDELGLVKMVCVV